MWAIVVLAVVVRLAYAFFAVSPKLTDDETHFWRIAGNIAHGKGYSYLGEATAWRPPVYTYALAGLRWIGLGVRGVQVVQAVVGASVPLLLVLSARRLKVPEWAALLAGLAGALYPPFVHVASQALSENASIPLLLLAVWLTLVVLDAPRGAHPIAIATGAAWGLAILARPAALPALAVAAIVAVVARRPVAAATGVIVAAVVVAPWVVRDDRAVGGPLAVVSNESFTLWVSNRLDAEPLKDVFRDPNYPGLQDYGVYGRDFPGIERLAEEKGFDFDHASEYERDRWFRRLVVDDVKADPWRFVRRAAAKSVLALAPAPDNASQQERTSPAAKVALWLTSGPLMVLGLAGLVVMAARAGPKGWFLAGSAVISLVGLATHLPYVRYRVGSVDPFLILSAAWLVAAVLDGLARRRSPAT
ncbi:MAG TPA: glycosyltransferase family 39 protein [Acidimicrobiales bacterium]|nr:glycosyltransferase family 39 protein [Acidimicrobiales bacterium]